MTHEEALNDLISSCCVRHELDNGFNEYVFDLCCVTYLIVAKHLGNFKYEVKEIRKVNNHE